MTSPPVHRLRDHAATVTFTEVNASGRFTQTPGEFAHQLSPYRQMASLIGGSEVDAPARSRELDVPGWGATYGNISGRDDCFVTWDTDIWRSVWDGTVPVSHRTYIDDRHQRVGVTAAALAVLDHRATGFRLTKGYLHTPHGMDAQLASGHITTDVARAYVAITRAYRAHGESIAGRYDADALDLSADWNLNLRKAWVRAWFAAYRRGTGLQLNWTPPYPQRGTHGTELIDATLYRGLTLASPSVLLRPAAGDDHVAYRSTFTGFTAPA